MVAPLIPKPDFRKGCFIKVNNFFQSFAEQYFKKSLNNRTSTSEGLMCQHPRILTSTTLG